MKRYELKLFSIGNLIVPKKTFTFISGNKEAITLKDDFRFDGNKNNGQGALRLTFNKSFNDTTIDLGDVIRIKAYDENNLTGQAIYSGFIDNLKRRADPEGESIEVTAFGLSALMNTFFVGGGPNEDKIREYNDDPSNIITDILNQFNAQYAQPVITFDPIPLFGSVIEFRVDYTSCLAALQQIHEITGWIFYVDGSGKFSTQPKGTVPDHILTFRKNINILEQNGNREDVVTRVIMEVLDFSSPFPDQRVRFTFDNLPAQAIFGIIEAFEERVDLVTNTGLITPTITTAGNQYLTDHEKPKNFLRIELNDTIDYVPIKPGDLVRIKNINHPIADAIINKTNYTSTRLSIDCEKTIDFGQEITKS